MLVLTVEPIDKRRFKISCEGGFVFALYKGELGRYKIEEKKELSEADYLEILNEILFKRALQRVIYILKASDKSENEIRRKLELAYYPKEAIEHAVSAAKRYRYIDDANYCRKYVEASISRKSIRQISFELNQKGISKDIIQSALENVPDKERENIEKLLKKRGYMPEECSREDRQKHMAYLMRKGFLHDDIEHVLNNKDLNNFQQNNFD